MFGVKTIPVEVRCDECGVQAKVSNLQSDIARKDISKFIVTHARRHGKTHFSWSEEMKPMCIAAVEGLPQWLTRN